MAEGRAHGSSSAAQGARGVEAVDARGTRTEPTAPARFPSGTSDELSTVPPSAPLARGSSAPIGQDSAPVVRTPTARESASALAAALYHTTELPHLNVETNDDVANVRTPLVPQQVRSRLLLAILLLPVLGAAAVVLYMELAG